MATKLTIPSKLGGYTVTTIGFEAFWGNWTLKKVTIPDTVTTIEAEAFRLCGSLKTVKIGSSVKTIGSCAFWDCYSLKSVTIPKSVTKIGSMAFGYTSFDSSGGYSNTAMRIKCYKGSAAEKYAKKYSVAYTLIDGKVSDVETPAVKENYNSASTSVRIKWTKVADASGYRIFQYNSTTKTWEKIAVVRNGSTTNYKVTGLSGTKSYKFKVQAYTKSGSKIYSSSKSTTLIAATKAKKVTVTATKTKTTVTLKWNKVRCSLYMIEQYDSEKKCWYFIDHLDSSETSYTVEGLTKGTVYKFRVVTVKYPVSWSNAYWVSGYKVTNNYGMGEEDSPKPTLYTYSATKKVTTKS